MTSPATRTEAPGLDPEDADDDRPMPHIIRVEVNVTAVIQEPNGGVFGRNMVDVTMGFGWRCDAPPPGTTDAQVNAALTKALSPVLALIETNLVFNGWVSMGQIEGPMVKSPASVVGEGRSDPVRVRVDFADEGKAVHD